MKKDIRELPFNELAQAYRAYIEEEKDKILDSSQEESLAMWEKTHMNKIETALANDDSEDACWDKWDEHYREKDPYDPRAWNIPDKVVERIKKDARNTSMNRFCERFKIAQQHDWLPYQLISYFGGWKLVRSADGTKYSAPKTLVANIKDDDFAFGAALFATSVRKPMFDDAPKTVKQYNSPINPLVPIILAGIKQVQNININDWHRDGIESLVGSELAETMLCDIPELTVSERLTIRHNAICNSLGDRAGVPNNPVSTIKLNKTNETAIALIPKLAKHIVIQTWCAHPTNWTKYTILDTKDWDARPTPLVSSDVLTTAATTKPKWSAKSVETTNDTPW